MEPVHKKSVTAGTRKSPRHPERVILGHCIPNYPIFCCDCRKSLGLMQKMDDACLRIIL